MYRFARHVCLERRRLTRIGVLAFISGFVLYSHIDMIHLGLPFPLFAGLLYLVAIVVAASVSTFVLPKLRRLTEAVALSRLGLALWVLGTHNYEILTSPLISATIVVASAILLMRAGDFVDGLENNWAAVLDRTSRAVGVNAVLDWLDNRFGILSVRSQQVVVVEAGLSRT